jgi:ribosome-binding ATPase YchF (GTP1/OBG family)
VAGLVPGAHEGRGLGNRFLDDLRQADALVHVVDVSGTTDAEGKATRGYDPSQDIVWLRGEIVRWICGNLMERWGSIKRRHIALSRYPIRRLAPERVNGADGMILRRGYGGGNAADTIFGLRFNFCSCGTLS